jgi:intracellular sulfur oxidation DsrE/DsrF family protein
MLRRDFLTRLSAAAPLLGRQTATPAVRRSSEPARHAQDDWLDEAPAPHRVVFDTWLADAFGEATGFAANWAKINKEQYGLTDADLAILIVARHGTTPFAFNETIWAKYGQIFAANMSTGDKVRHPNPSTNPYAKRLAEYTKQSMRLAICGLTLKAYVEIIASETGGEPDAVLEELTANAIGRARFVPAGIVAVTRAQEHGYALISIG